MNRADLLYSCLRDGSPWTRRDIYEHVGEFFLVNNAAVELRDRGLDVQWSRSGRLHLYQLVSGSLEIPQNPEVAASGGDSRQRSEAADVSSSGRSWGLSSDSLTPSALEPQPPNNGSAALVTRPSSAAPPSQLSLEVAG